MRANKSFQWKKSARVTKILRRMRVKDLSRRWTVRAGAAAILAFGISAMASRPAHNPPVAAQDQRAVANQPLDQRVAVNQQKRVVQSQRVVAKAAPVAPSPTIANAPGTRSADKPVDDAAETAAAKAEMVTITGCLERDDEMFRLKDTDGEEAPKSRSWKTGFLTKRNASITVANAANQKTLQSHVGQRVSVTGLLVERKMQVRSLKRLAASCAGTSKV